MRSDSGLILGLMMLAGLLTAAPARAEEPAVSCEVPDYLLTSESTLPKVAEAIKAGHSLDILVVGSRSSTINTTNASEASAYPGRLQAILKEKLPSIAVNVSVEIQAKKTAEEVAAGMVKRSTDPDDFRSGVDEGVVALQEAGTDVVLMNPQYSPRTETMISAPPYLDSMRVVAQQHDVPLFDRFAIMRHWNESGDFDLFSTFHGIELAKRVHDCLGRALSQFVIDAAHTNPAQQN
jgi:hypothetical protein